MGLAVDLEPGLVESAVLCARRDAPEERAFRGERDRLYAIAEPEVREAAFAAHHTRWFARLGLGRPLERALDEYPEIADRCERCIVASAPAGAHEAADLLVAPPARPTVLLRVRPETVAAPARFLLLLRRELLHIADMLDPAFGYRPRLASTGRGPLADRLLADRYRVVWDVVVDGRLARMGRAPSSMRQERLQEFRRAFPGPDAEAAFERLFAGPRCAHADLLGFAAESAPARSELAASAGH
jgi:hypothetical protein